MRYEEISFQFVENEEIGFSKEQINYIKRLIKSYVMQYPGVVLKIVCDYFSWDHNRWELNEYTYTHNRENELYSKYNSLAQYNDEDKLIGFNHIRMSDMELDNEQISERIKQIGTRVENIRQKYEALYSQCRFLGINMPSFDSLFTQEDKIMLEEHEIVADKITEDYFEVMQIRLMEECKFIRRVVAHEFGHAIAYSYKLDEDPVIMVMYEKVRDGFEDIQEFVAECFMASELTNEVNLANRVKERIREGTGTDSQ